MSRTTKTATETNIKTFLITIVPFFFLILRYTAKGIAVISHTANHIHPIVAIIPIERISQVQDGTLTLQ
ncbi:hypothetical protein CHITON_0230 [Thermococcus chitonophagus]|uniref:Uncharacterized protein n=1 Tax=Thermococcus chitonophagus TaxID=54262 RepID=A0A160VR25_9EURY|nr:hypothetical protein CHITON_0230 [Thermococcus chitonophagus]